MRTQSIIAVLLLSSLRLLGQTFGEITGEVADSSHAAVPDSVVTLTNISTNAVRLANSNGQGLYTFASVPPGNYSMKVEHPGFKSVTSNNIAVQVQQTVRLDFTLEVGQVTESVQVEAAAD